MVVIKARQRSSATSDCDENLSSCLGAYERDNTQRGESLELEIVPVVRSLIRRASSPVVATSSQTSSPLTSTNLRSCNPSSSWCSPQMLARLGHGDQRKELRRQLLSLWYLCGT